MKYFWDPPGKEPGLNSDIERHREKRAELDKKIQELDKEDLSRMDQARLRTYRHFRYLLEVSFADVVSKLGRKKK